MTLEEFDRWLAERIQMPDEIGKINRRGRLNRETVSAALKRTKGSNLDDAASRLGVSREILQRWLDQGGETLDPRKTGWGRRDDMVHFGPRHHRVDRPDGSQSWWRAGKEHRDGDLPAVIGADGRQEWWRDGELHRDGDLPSIIYGDGTQVWYMGCKRHRDGDLPAYIGADGSQEWWVDGERVK